MSIPINTGMKVNFIFKTLLLILLCSNCLLLPPFGGTNSFAQPILLWAKSMGGTSSDYGHSISVDGSGNVYTTGWFQGTTDFDPGAGVFNLVSAGSADIFLSKLDSSGNFLWAFRAGGTEYDYAHSIALDPAGSHVCIMGDQYSPAVDYDPGAGVYNVSNTGIESNFIARYDNNGNFFCAMSITPGHNETVANRHIAADGSGKVWVTAAFDAAAADFDPCPPFYNPGWYGGGNYDIYVAKYDFSACNCSASALSVTAAGTGVLCNSQCTGTATVTPASGTAPYTYSWNTAPVQTTQTVTGLCAVTYSVLVTDASSATATANVTITQPSAITTSVSGTADICGQNNGSATVSASGGVPGYAYSWSNGATAASITLNPSSTATYSVIATDTNGCSDTASITVTVSPPPVAAISGTDTICEGDNAFLTASGGGNYSWNTGATTSSISLPLSSTSTFTVIVSIGSCSDTAFHTVNILQNPTADAGVNVTITQGQSATLTATGGGTYSWSPSTGLSCTTCANPIATPPFGGQGGFCVTVTDTNGCTGTACVTVFVKVEPIDCSNAGELYLPNGFSPNGDGENDVLKIYYADLRCIESFKLVIYNRWGEKILETTNATFQWDGASKGKIMNTAVFVYYLKVTLTSGEKFSRKGNISLIR